MKNNYYLAHKGREKKNHKYIRKYKSKKSGKWVYVYPEDLTLKKKHDQEQLNAAGIGKAASRLTNGYSKPKYTLKYKGNTYSSKSRITVKDHNDRIRRERQNYKRSQYNKTTRAGLSKAVARLKKTMEKTVKKAVSELKSATKAVKKKIEKAIDKVSSISITKVTDKNSGSYGYYINGKKIIGSYKNNHVTTIGVDATKNKDKSKSKSKSNNKKKIIGSYKNNHVTTISIHPRKSK